MRAFGKLLVLVILGLALTGCSVEIMHDLQETEANEILAALHGHGVQGHKSRTRRGSKSTYMVSVPRSASIKAWQILRRENLPRPSREGLGEVFGKQGLIPTATQERALMHHALAGELSTTLQRVEGVLEARVHLVMPARDPMALPDAPRSSPKASVLLLVSDDPPLTRKSVGDLVAASVKDLDPKNVSVLIVKGPAHVRKRAAAGITADTSSVGPFVVARESRAALLATLIVGLVLLVIMGLVSILSMRRNRIMAATIRSGAARAGQRSASDQLDSSLSLLGRSLTGAREGSTGGEKDKI